jgi:hypothetical protein
MIVGCKQYVCSWSSCLIEPALIDSDILYLWLGTSFRVMFNILPECLHLKHTDIFVLKMIDAKRNYLVLNVASGNIDRIRTN